MRYWKPWTPEDDARIRQLMPSSDAEIGKAIGRSKDAVRQRRVALGIRHRPQSGGRMAVDNFNWQADARIGSAKLLEALRGAQ